MKPTLLYLRNYIDQNYNSNRYQEAVKKNQKEFKVKKSSSQEFIFKEKKKFQCQNTNKKEFYFKAPKSFNASRVRGKVILQERKSHQTQKTIESLSKFSVNTCQVENICQAEKEIKKQSKSIIKKYHESMFRNQVLNKKNHHLEKSNFDDSVEKQVRFAISPPNKIENHEGSFEEFDEEKSSSTNQKMKPLPTSEFEENGDEPSVYKKILQQQKNRYMTPRYYQNGEEKRDHTKMECKMMKKIGYDNLSDYLIEMKKFQKMAKKHITQECYYPLDCMKLSQQTVQSYERNAMIVKRYFQKKAEEFSKTIEIQQNFNVNTIEMELRNTFSQSGQKRSKSKFSKAKESIKVEENFDQKGKKFLFQYEKMIICNCANKKFFTFPISQQTNYNSFLKLTTPVLDIPSSKESNNQSIAEYYGLHFCCLLNIHELQKEYFFWIGKPIHFYQKDLLINVIDHFLSEINAVTVIENEKIWIVDFHGRNSFFLKSMLPKCSQLKQQQINLSVPKKDNSRFNKRSSFSRKLSFDVSESLLNFMVNPSLEPNEQLCLRKQRNNISTKGNFQMLYESTENLR